ncbi:hypothetical protein PL75_03070 [Neisseria arctica]|uniref:Uncharacterized protein n=1 Tax=Neisseria arctica TaxID=1470200 RepID=A0A0J0YSV1_9NEIS|nr:hypothetical protein [Neisseria arctica]KLT73230.1 hypothetical protein PL75_03070 [Neisseria arctica]UOO87525.1 hypothetical protein LVJ86_04575 [Neisseria arctica]
MNENRLSQLINETAELMRLFQDQCQTIGNQTNDKISHHLEQARSEIVQSVRTDVKNSLERSISDYEQTLNNARDSIIHHTKEFNTYLEATSAKNRRLAQLSWIITASSLGLLLVCGIALSLYYKSIIQDLKPEAEMVKLINESDITRCGEYLCVKTDKSKYGNYLIVKKRAP